MRRNFILKNSFKKAVLIICLCAGYQSLVFAQETPPNEPPYVTDPSDTENEVVTKPVDEKPVPIFEKPKAPPKGGKVRMPHPNAGKGLLRINKDGSYQYKTTLRSKSQSASLRLGQMTPPKIVGSNSSAGVLSYESMYGNKNIFGLSFEYEWQPFTRFGRVGFIFGTGVSSARANGYFKNARASGSTQAEEVYTLYMIPASAFITYRFEYARRQWVVPYIKAGGTLYGLIESRDDGKTPTFAQSTAAGGGGGILVSLTALDSEGAFIMDRQYGIADMYLSVEAIAMQGLRSDIDFTTQSILAGITVDF
jgi:hypothetical protein